MKKRTPLYEETTYERTSDEWKEYAHHRKYYFDERTGKASCRTVVEFQDTRSGTNAVTSDTTRNIPLTKLPTAAKAKLAAKLAKKH